MSKRSRGHSMKGEPNRVLYEIQGLWGNSLFLQADTVTAKGTPPSHSSSTTVNNRILITMIDWRYFGRAKRSPLSPGKHPPPSPIKVSGRQQRRKPTPPVQQPSCIFPHASALVHLPSFFRRSSAVPLLIFFLPETPPLPSLHFYPK